MKKVIFLWIFLFFSSTLFASKVIVVNLSKQRIYAKENGHTLFSGAISSGKRGHRTPTGSFRVIEKDKFHRSSKYPAPHGGALMPYMHRITKSGIAIHAGRVPGYPASHGCIRVTRTTAKKLWRWSYTGIPVKVIGVPASAKSRKIGKRSRYTKVHKRIKKRRVVKKIASLKRRGKRIAQRGKYSAHRHYTKKRVRKNSSKVAKRVKMKQRYYAKKRHYRQKHFKGRKKRFTKKYRHKKSIYYVKSRKSRKVRKKRVKKYVHGRFKGYKIVQIYD